MKRYLAVVALASLAAASPAGAGARVYVQIGPPEPIVETVVVAPSPQHVWVPGYYRWSAGAYVWAPGRWRVPPAHYHAWVPGHWSHHQAHGWYWVNGHWR